MIAVDKDREVVRVNYRQRNGIYFISAPKFCNIICMSKDWAVVRELCDELMEVVIPYASIDVFGKTETPA